MIENFSTTSIYLCKYKESTYNSIFEIRFLQYSPNRSCLQYSRTLGDKFNGNAVIVAWVETTQFWKHYELLDEIK